VQLPDATVATERSAIDVKGGGGGGEGEGGRGGGGGGEGGGHTAGLAEAGGGQEGASNGVATTTTAGVSDATKAGGAKDIAAGIPGATIVRGAAPGEACSDEGLGGLLHLALLSPNSSTMLHTLLECGKRHGGPDFTWRWNEQRLVLKTHTFLYQKKV
jgi:hypothetical protein